MLNFFHMQLAVRQQHLILDLFLTERMKLNNFVLNLQTVQRFSFVIFYRMCNYISNTLAPSTRWRNTWGRSLSVMATLPTTLCMRTWWRIFLPKRMRTKTASYPPESSLTSTMNFKVSLCAAAHSGSLSVLFLSVHGCNTLVFGIYCKRALRLPEPLSVL